MRHVISAILTGVLVGALVGPPAVAQADPITQQDMLRRPEVASIYPALEKAVRIGDRSGIFASHTVVKNGRRHCDRYRTFKGTSNRNNSWFSTGEQETVTLNQSVVRLPWARDAKAVLRHYRHFVRVCEGDHATTDGEGGRATMRVRTWDATGPGDGSVGVLEAFSQQGLTTWRRLVAVRVGRVVTVVEAEIPSGMGSASRLLAVAELAAAKLAR